MSSYILYLNGIVIFVLSLLIISTLLNRKENLKAKISFVFLFFIVVITCIANLLTFYFKIHQLVFLQISFLSIGYFFGATIYFYVHSLLDKQVPKSWNYNFYVSGLIFISGLYFLFIDESSQKKILVEIIDAKYLPYVALNNFILIISIFYLFKSKRIIKNHQLDEKDIFFIHKKQRKNWALEFVNYLLWSLVIFFFILIGVALTNVIPTIYTDLIIMPFFMLLIYSFIVIKSMMRYKEMEIEYIVSQVENQNKLQSERLAISRDLHDNIGSQLTFIISSVESLKYRIENENSFVDENLSSISSFAKDAIVELRDTIWAMNSDQISFSELEIRINNFIERAKVAAISISFSIAIENRIRDKVLSSKQAMNIYRVIQEGITNAIKYSKADVITVNIKDIDGKIKVSIQDNGEGFEKKEIIGNGLNNMKYRIEEIGGVLNLVTSAEGTIISFEI